MGGGGVPRGAGRGGLGGGCGCVPFGVCLLVRAIPVLVALVGDERGGVPPGGRVLAWLGAVVVCSWWWCSFFWVRVVVGVGWWWRFASVASGGLGRGVSGGWCPGWCSGSGCVGVLAWAGECWRGRAVTRVGGDKRPKSGGRAKLVLLGWGRGAPFGRGVVLVVGALLPLGARGGVVGNAFPFGGGLGLGVGN